MGTAMIKVTVADIRQVAPMIREFTFEAVDSVLPCFSPGSHIMVTMEHEGKCIRNAYSLCSDPFDSSSYKIAVRLQERSRGGSAFMHEHVKVGDSLSISTPVNYFVPDWRAKKHVLIAGGVGITPFLSYLYAFERQQLDFDLHYLFRSSQTGAYHQQLADKLGASYSSYDSDQSQRASINEILDKQPIGTHVYVCGPESLINDVEQTAKASGWPQSHIHYEVFAAPKPGKPFIAKINSSGMEIEVGPETSLLEALEAANVNVPNLCRGGVCGQCYTEVLSGEIEHRDNYLSDAEKASQKCLLPCVSRAVSTHLTLGF